MPESFTLSLPTRAIGVARRFPAYVTRWLEAARKWRLQQRDAYDCSALSAMSDRELTDLGVGRGEVTREAYSRGVL